LKRIIIFLALVLSISIAGLPGFAALKEQPPAPNSNDESPDRNPGIVEAKDSEDIIIELEGLPLVDYHFPLIKGFKAVRAEIRGKLQAMNPAGKVSATLGNSLGLAQRFWKMEPKSALREPGFRRSLELFKLWVRLWKRLKFISSKDAKDLTRKADLALSEFDPETRAMIARQRLKKSHQQLIDDLKDILADAGYPPDKFSPQIKAEFFNLANGLATAMPLTVIKKIRELPEVKRVEKDFSVQPLGVVPANVNFIGAPLLWDQGYTGKYHTIAIIDTGVDLIHIDLEENIWINQQEISGADCPGSPLDDDGDDWISIKDLKEIFANPEKSNSCLDDFNNDGLFNAYDLISPGDTAHPNPLINNVDDDNNLYIDDLLGWNFYGGVPGENAYNDPTDELYHGTHVAGIAAGNGELNGVAPDASILPLRVCLEGSCDGSFIMEALDYIINTPKSPYAEVVNISLGSLTDYATCSPLSDSVTNAIENGNITVVISAGNDGPDLYTINCPGNTGKAITVGNSVAKDNSAPDSVYYYSSRGPAYPDFNLKPDIVAPGYQICAARFDAISGYSLCDLDANGVFNHILLTGTSMAAPHIAGAALIIKQIHPDFTPESVKAFLMQNAVDLNQPPYIQGAGRVNLANALIAQAVASPQSLNFGIDDLNQSIWGPEFKTLTVTNLSDNPHLYAINSAGQFPIGVTYNIPDNNILIPPGASGTFQVSIAVDNNIIPDPPLPPSSPFPPIYFDHLRVTADENNVSMVLTYFTKACIAKYGCRDCDNPWPTILFDNNGFIRFYTSSPAAGYIPVQCGVNLNSMLHDWREDGGQAYYIKENIISTPFTDLSFLKSDAVNNYFIDLKDKFDNSIAIDNHSGPYGIHIFAYKTYYRSGDRVQFGIEGRPDGSLAWGEFYFTEVSDNFEFFWDLMTLKDSRYYSFNDYLGDGIESSITFSNTPQDFRHPRLSLKPPNGYYLMKYVNGNLSEVQFPGSGITDDILYFLPIKSPQDRPFNSSLDFKIRHSSSGVYEYTTGNIRTSPFTAELEIYKTEKEYRYIYPRNYLEPFIKNKRDAISLLKNPPVWSGIAKASGSAGSYLNISVIPHKYYLRDTTISAPLFSLQSGAMKNTTFQVIATDINGNKTERSINNISNYDQLSAQVVYGKTRVRFNYPNYIIWGKGGSAYANIIFNPPSNDLRAPFIDRLQINSDGEMTDVFHPDTDNMILLDISDTLYGETPAKPDPNVKLYYRVFELDEIWQELPLEQYGDWKKAAFFKNTYTEHTYISLKIIAWDQGEIWEAPQGNIMEYVAEPALYYDPDPVGCRNLPPLPGIFYKGDVTGDGVSRSSPEQDYLEDISEGIADPEDLDLSCVIPPNDPASILDLDGNQIIDTADLMMLMEMMASDGGVYDLLLEIDEIPALDRFLNTTGEIKTKALTVYGYDNGAVGVEYKIVSDPGQCILLTGRNPHPDWNGARDQSITVSGQGNSVFEISQADGISTVEVSVNTNNCTGPSQVEIAVCVPDERDIVEYCNCSDPDTWFICVCAGGDLPPGCDCDSMDIGDECMPASMPGNCTFDAPYVYQNKLSEKVCAEPVIINIP